MKKIHRRLLLFTVTAIFIGVAPLLILYAMGYRAATSGVDPLPVGVLLVETEPTRADITINGEPAGRSPRSIANLPSGEIEVTISKEGYQTWRKRVTIEPTRATELRTVHLFLNETTSQSLGKNIATFSVSPNRQLIASVTHDRTLHVIDENGKPVQETLLLAQVPTSLLWSPTSTALLMTFPNGAYAWTSVGLQSDPQYLPELTGASHVTWDPRVPGRILYQVGTRLSAMSTLSAQSEVLVTGVSVTATSSRQIYVAHTTGQLSSYTLQGELIAEILPKSETTITNLFVTPAGAIAYTTSEGGLNLITKDRATAHISDKALRVGWSPNGKMLMVAPDEYSLHVYNVSDERAPVPSGVLHLITRLSRPIVSPQWFAGNQQLIYQIGDQIIISEINTQEPLNTYQVDSTNTGNAMPAVGQDGTVLFYLKKNMAENATELVATTITEE